MRSVERRQPSAWEPIEETLRENPFPAGKFHRLEFLILDGGNKLQQHLYLLFAPGYGHLGEVQEIARVRLCPDIRSLFHHQSNDCLLPADSPPGFSADPIAPVIPSSWGGAERYRVEERDLHACLTAQCSPRRHLSPTTMLTSF